MAHIGTRALAQEILEMHDGGHISDDWQRLGAGSYRHVYLHKPTNVVYKVPTRYWQGDTTYENGQEVRVAQRLRKRTGGTIGKFIRIPKVSGFKIAGEVIVAMEVVKGTLFRDVPKEEQPAWRRACLELYRLNFGDMHTSNFFLDDDGYIDPVDMASPMSRPGRGDMRCILPFRHLDKEIAAEIAKRDW